MQPTAATRCSAPTGNSSSGLEDPNEPPDVFCKLGSLIVEGRVPKGDDRGFCEGPHVPQTGAAAAHRHECSEDSYMCKKDENFRRHMLLLWQNNVPVSIEVLLSPDCRLGGKANSRSSAAEFSTVPEPGSVLLEQWTVSVHHNSSALNPRSDVALISSRGLFQAVRSYLHFSQLSAWLASSNGRRPKNVLFRITIPGEAFASKFACDHGSTDLHVFPPAGVNRAATVNVSVRSLPRSDEIPAAVCCHNVSPASSGGSVGSEDEEQGKLAGAGALAWKEMNNSDQDLRKALVRSKLAAAECNGSSPAHTSAASLLPRSDSLDSMLGESLLDPPQSLQKMPPKRYQSPSRCGSPSLEAPEHLMFGGSRRSSNANGDALAPAVAAANERCARQDLIRRRDLNLYYGLHPRLLQPSSPGTPPRLSLPLRANNTLGASSTAVSVVRTPQGPCRAFRLDPVDVQLCCNISGKHVCSPDDEEGDNSIGLEPTDLENAADSPFKAPTVASAGGESWTHEYSLGEDTNLSLEESGIGNDSGATEDDLGASAATGDKWNTWMKSACSSRRSSKDDDVLLFPKSSCCSSGRKRPSLQDIFDDGSDRVNIPTLNPVTQVYRAQTADLTAQDQGDLLLNSIIRTSERNRRLLLEEEERARASTGLLLEYRPTEFNDGTHRSCCQNRDLKGVVNNCAANGLKEPAALRLRSLSENTFAKQEEDAAKEEVDGHHLIPLDLSFEDSSVWSDYDTSSFHSPTDEVCSEEEQEEEEKPSAVPTSVDKATFRKSFNSAASMVFHRRTGLPLMSSPAPLRKGKEKFDFDVSIASPNDIKKALLSSSSSGKNRTKLSASAPATVASSCSSNNLLGSFEESVLNGRLEPVSTVEGFTAEIGASGSFHPRHRTVPVTVFFYTLGDNGSNVSSSPYLGHINLGRKGYRVPDKGTIQVTLFNPLGTVVKMFVVVYDLSEMPANSQTFLRQKSLYMPSSADLAAAEEDVENCQKWLRYLVHLRFASSKSGKLYLHTDIRMIIFRKSDLDTAADHSPGKGFELRSFTRGPNNPKFSPRK